ncbi:MAG: hypothetical protein JZU65_14155, partial [Chlorobium sp.]|nr:hypothetical protein [Chlorobium sp.]
LLDMPSVIRLAEQRVGRVDRMNSPHEQIEVWWPLDSEDFSLKTDKKFFRRYAEVKDILGSNLDLPDDLVPESMVDGPSTIEEMVKKLEELDREGTSWDGIHDAFQPVRDLVDLEKGLVPAEVYVHVKDSKARVLSSVSLVKAKRAWAFFAISGIDRGAPKWIFFESLTAKPVTHLEEVAHCLRRFLDADIENRSMDKDASLLIEKFLHQIIASEKDLLPRRKQRAIEEMGLVVSYYLKKAKENEEMDRVILLEQIEGLIAVPHNDQERPDLENIAETWLDLTRELWYEKLLKRRRVKPLRLRDIRKDLQQHQLTTLQLQEAFSSVQQAQPLHSRIVSAIVGVPD